MKMALWTYVKQISVEIPPAIVLNVKLFSVL